MGVPAAEVFFAEPLLAEDVEPFLIARGFWRPGPRKTRARSKPHRPKVRSAWVYDIQVAPEALGLTPDPAWREHPINRDGRLAFAVRAAAVHEAHWEFLLQHDVLPEDMAQVVSVMCHTNPRPLGHHAVDAIAELIEREFGGRLRSRAE